MADDVKEVAGTGGALWDSLSRNIKQIKQGRAYSILEDAETAYKRKIENMELALRKLNRKVEDSLDMSPDSTTALLMKDFDAEIFIEEDSKIAYEIRNLAIQLNECKKRYNTLFGFKYEIEVI